MAKRRMDNPILFAFIEAFLSYHNGSSQESMRFIKFLYYFNRMCIFMQQKTCGNEAASPLNPQAFYYIKQIIQ